MIQEWWGLVDHIKDVCDRFAAEGFVALAPDLYHGKHVAEPDEAGKLMMALQLDRAAKDMSGAVDEVGGSLQRQRSRRRRLLHGRRPGPHARLAAARTRCEPSCRSTGSCRGRVPSPTTRRSPVRSSATTRARTSRRAPKSARALVRTLREAGNSDVAIHIYPEADHAFFNDTRPEVYDPEASALAWQRTLDFLRSRIG